MFEKAGLEDAAGTGAMDRLLDDAGERIVAINETTRDEIRGIIAKGIEEGVPMRELGDRVRGSGAFTSDRAERIARTETATVLNQSQLQTFQSYGVQQVRVLDGTRDAPCADANGQIWSVDEALGNPIAHPNCVRDFVPIVVAEQLAGVGGAVAEEEFAGYTEEQIQRDYVAQMGDPGDWLVKHQHTFYDEAKTGWSELADDGYSTYKGAGYKKMNAYLRGDQDIVGSNQYEAIKRLTDATVDALRLQTTTSRGVLYRGSVEEVYANATVGETLTTNIISSTSVKQDVAIDFMQNMSSAARAGNRTLVRILAPDGTPGVGMRTGEYEFTLPPQVNLRVVDVQQVAKKHYGIDITFRQVTVEVVP